MKQKVVIKVSMHSAKCKTKALKTAVSVSGVISAELYGDDKDKLMITGEGIDSVQLTNSLRKKVGFSELISVTPLSEDNKKPGIKEPLIDICQHHTPYIYCHEVRDNNQDACTIM
ncbi:Heavy metal-associated isoprenylated plant protein [Thalictrum thalictroides]|uniref:Heavy metal-associated isoprenylated plant protein n=1 Tax=Thalictrum thalictroides TaxID=46969 RepID=A0A7J6W691_THATH|nr:Heavy metal-associated isoprenylated plant protein [Thalictrum thalictroides]